MRDHHELGDAWSVEDSMVDPFEVGHDEGDVLGTEVLFCTELDIQRKMVL
jgi:hypothetical protein